jgi:uncharacterized membrane protein
MPNTPNLELVQEIGKIKGSSDEEIYQALLLKGYKIGEIQSTLIAIQSQVVAKNETRKTEEVESKAKNADSLTSIFGIVGSIILGIGVISLVASNWSQISSGVKITILFFGVLLSHIAALITRYNFNLDKISNALHLAGSIIFGAGLFLIGQIYNLPISWSDAFYIWVIGVGILGMILNNFIHEYLAYFIVSISSISIFSIFSYYSLYSYNQNQELRDYSSLILSFLSVVIFSIWANKHRLSNQDPTLKNIF